jgi:hypothetical protein
MVTFPSKGSFSSIEEEVKGALFKNKSRPRMSRILVSLLEN